MKPQRCTVQVGNCHLESVKGKGRRSQWPRGLRRGSAALRLLGLWVRIPAEAWIFICCECCVLSGRGLCDGPITRPGESYRLWCVVCDLETSCMRRPWPTGAVAPNKKKRVKVKFTLEEARKAHRRSRGIAVLFL